METMDMSAGFSRPGSDTRQWLSVATVDPDNDDARSVVFDGDDGPLPFGPLVNVTLQPSNLPVTCRVVSGCAGNGEGEWYPFLPGDEVLVAVPEGDERAGCLIIGRLNNGIDQWPRTVAGQDATKNTFGFRRMRTPYILETASSYMVRSALTGANFTIDQTGNLFLVSGDGHKLTFGADAISLGNADNSSFFQIDTDTGDATLQASNTAQLIVSAALSQWITPGQIQFSASGTGSPQHAITLEQVVNLFINFLYLLADQSPTLKTDFTSGPTSVLFPATFPAGMNTALMNWLGIVPLPGGGAGSPAPPTPTTGGGNVAPFFPLVYGSVGVITQTLLTQLSNFDITGLIVGIGRGGFLL